MTTQVLIHRPSASDGARALKTNLVAVNVPSVLTDKTRFQRKYLIINWGSNSTLIAGAGSKILNSSAAVEIARNKLSTFNKLKENGFTNLPEYWTRPPTDAERGKSIILERTVNGQGGSGITIKRAGQPLGHAPLYVRYIPKEIELRVHVVNGKAVAVQQKRKVEGREQTDSQKLIRSHNNGWVFSINNVNEEAAAKAKPIAVEACRLIGLDFGAVDIVIPKKEGAAPVFLEVNTRPGLGSETVLGAYADELKRLASEVHPFPPAPRRRKTTTTRRNPNASNSKRNHARLAGVQSSVAGQRNQPRRLPRRAM